MHEMHATSALLQGVIEGAQKSGAARIAKLTIIVGELSDMADEPVTMYFNNLSEGTIAEGAELVFEHVPATLRCAGCDKTYPKSTGFACPSCGKDGVLVGTSREFYVKEIEVE